MKVATILLLFVFFCFGSDSTNSGFLSRNSGKRFVGTSGWILINLVPNQENPPSFFQLNFGYWLSNEDVLFFEAITWKYNAALGMSSGKKYPGYIRDYGIGIAYQRFLWKGIYTSIHALPMIQKYVNDNNDKIQNGFMLHLILRAGYHIKFLKNRLFIEPSVGFAHWPLKTKGPAEFEVLTNKWPENFQFEPGLHLGFKF